MQSALRINVPGFSYAPGQVPGRPWAYGQDCSRVETNGIDDCRAEEKRLHPRRQREFRPMQRTARFDTELSETGAAPIPDRTVTGWFCDAGAATVGAPHALGPALNCEPVLGRRGVIELAQSDQKILRGCLNEPGDMRLSP